MGSSNMKGSLMIWTRSLTKYGTIGPFQTSCPATHSNLDDAVHPFVMKVGGGQLWGEIYQAAAAADREMLGGGSLTVGAAGGWLQGGGLSALSRLYGYGVDSVLAFEVVTADAEVVMADACSHPDLFWALRGGGGGCAAPSLRASRPLLSVACAAQSPAPLQ